MTPGPAFRMPTPAVKLLIWALTSRSGEAVPAATTNGIRLSYWPDRVAMTPVMDEATLVASVLLYQPLPIAKSPAPLTSVPPVRLTVNPQP